MEPDDKCLLKNYLARRWWVDLDWEKIKMSLSKMDPTLVEYMVDGWHSGGIKKEKTIYRLHNYLNGRDHPVSGKSMLC